MMKTIFDQVSNACSKYTTNVYSTSFSFGIKALGKELHQPIYNVYGFVRFADEIVDSFHGFNKETEEIAFTDSWGDRYKERWVGAEEALHFSQNNCWVIEY